MAKFFINRPYRCHGHFDPDGDRRHRCHGATADRAVPELAPPEILLEATYVGADALTSSNRSQRRSSSSYRVSIT